MIFLLAVVMGLRPRKKSEILMLPPTLERIALFQAQKNLKLPISHQWIFQVPFLLYLRPHNLRFNLSIRKDYSMRSKMKRMLRMKDPCVVSPNDRKLLQFDPLIRISPQ